MENGISEVKSLVREIRKCQCFKVSEKLTFFSTWLANENGPEQNLEGIFSIVLSQLCIACEEYIMLTVFKNLPKIKKLSDLNEIFSSYYLMNYSYVE